MNTKRLHGFTLIELLSALLVLSLLALLSYRALAAVGDTRAHVTAETEKWRSVTLFFDRFERDIMLAAPRTARDAPAWRGDFDAGAGSSIDFSRGADAVAGASPRRVSYRLNHDHAIEAALWPALDNTANAAATRYPLLDGVARFELRYLGADRSWSSRWPVGAEDASLPRALQVRVTLASGEDIVRTFSLR